MMSTVRLMKRLKIKHWALVLLVLILTLHYGGVLLFMREKSFKEFQYPLVGDVSRYVGEMKRGEIPSKNPVYNHDYYISKHPKHKCLTEDEKQYHSLRVLYLVKSAVGHFDRREVIRKTWGMEKRFADVPIRTVFILGSVPDDLTLQGRVENEFQQFKDLVQGSFEDNYYNNSLKAAMGLRWAVEHCSRSRFYVFVDDDYYVSTRNLLRFLRNPLNYPGYLEEDVISFDEDTNMFPRNGRKHRDTAEVLKNLDNVVLEPILGEPGDTIINKTKVVGIENKNGELFKEGVEKQEGGKPDVESGTEMFDEEVGPVRKLNQLIDFDLPEDVKLFAGYVFPDSRPHRHRISKWFVPLEEYPYNRWPAYVTAGAYVLSREGLVDMYYTSYFTKLFRFDDIWLGLIAQKASIEPLHSSEFYFHRKVYSVRNYKYVVASHGFSDSRELSRVWNQQREAGNA